MSSHVAPLLAGLIISAAQLTSGSPVADAPVVAAPVAALLTNGTYTQVVTAITTYCPEPTVIYHGKFTYTIKEPTTFTITDCPCTITHTGPVPTGVAPGPECAATCAAAYDKCRSAPDANRATCAAEYAGCLGYSPFGPDGSLVTPTACSGTAVVPTATAVPPITTGVFPPTGPSGPECAATCAAAYDKCRSAPDANRATCAAEYAGCLGYSPFGPDGSLVTPTACSGTATAVPPITTVAPPTGTAVPPITTGVLPPATTGAACVTGCNDAYNKCRSAPGANMSTCAAQYAGCLGYSPFGPDGSLVTPTACSGSATGAAPTATAKPLPSVVQVASAGRASFGVAVAAVCGLAALAMF
ncbi:uncharacterized protein CCOS01_04426 [Colletotrichum costaricense]|uniref:Cell wall glycoprotein n=1 Tax=Colletotrichum costaricense TaxID=1209916 RepID=A0AAJ0E401_9PEZI|nr:uncharacterized protein CCOS01_04426 [Colletotrichum costaricense]KAK1532443.1 hypothetical protein CCOS01_04426 [Colletotrichum costaricense]